jgi:hypothetical protein
MTATLRAAHARHAHHSGQRLDDTLDQYAGAMFSSFLCPADRATLHIIGTRAYHLAAKAPARAYLAAPTWLRAGERWVAVYLGANVPAPRAVPVPAAIEVPPGRLAAPPTHYLVLARCGMDDIPMRLCRDVEDAVALCNAATREQVIRAAGAVLDAEVSHVIGVGYVRFAGEQPRRYVHVRDLDRDEIAVPPGKLSSPDADRAHLTATLGDHRVRLCPMPDTWSETVLTINRWQRADPDLHDFGTDKIDGDCPEYAAVKACLLATAIDRAERDEDARGMLGATSNELV